MIVSLICLEHESKIHEVLLRYCQRFYRFQLANHSKIWQIWLTVQTVDIPTLHLHKCIYCGAVLKPDELENMNNAKDAREKFEESLR
jgi:hypothetical protein